VPKDEATIDGLAVCSLCGSSSAAIVKAITERISINQLINSALAEKVSALMTVKYLEERANRGSQSRFDRALLKVKDLESQEENCI
jgi:hypothetical protein